MKYLKRVAYVFVFCLALVGLFALLKKAPQLHIPEEDHQYLEEVFGGVKFDGNGQASHGGLSGLMDHGVEGAPPVSSSLAGASNAPPSSFGSNIAPVYGNDLAVAEAPVFGSASSEAPVFQASNSSLPTLSTEQPVSALVAPQYGSQYQNQPQNQALPVAAPPSIFPEPKTEDNEAPKTDLKPADSPPLSAVPSAAPPSWDGPATGVDSIPSSVSAKPRGDFGVSEGSIFVQNRTSDVLLANVSSPENSGNIDPFSTGQVSNFSSSVETSPAEFSSTDSFPTPPINTVTDTVPADTVVDTATKPVTVFVKPQLKRLPETREPAAGVSILPKPTEELNSNVIEPQLVDSTDVVPNDYRQTSMRNTMVLAPMRRSSPDEAPKVSFAQQAPKTTTPAETNELPGLVVSPPEMIETETLPFVEAKPEPVGPERIKTEQRKSMPAVPPFPVIKEIASINKEVAEKSLPSEKESNEIELVQTMPSATPAFAAPPVAAGEIDTARKNPDVSQTNQFEGGIRDTVGRFIDAQCRAAESGDSERVRSAYIQLSRLCEHKDLNEAERSHLKPILDRMGLDIIFSCKQHILEPAYVVKAGDTIDSIAAAYRVSPALIMKINGLTGARPLKPGSTLKVVFGQFDARVSVKHGEMILILGGLYAGRFPVTVGKEIQNLRGDFVVTKKDESFRGKVLTLNNGVTLRCDNQTENALRFSERDANELFDILTQSSVITLEN